MKAKTGSLGQIQVCEDLPSEMVLRASLPTSLLLPGLGRDNDVSSQHSPALFPALPLTGKVTGISYLCEPQFSHLPNGTTLPGVSPAAAPESGIGEQVVYWRGENGRCREALQQWVGDGRKQRCTLVGRSRPPWATDARSLRSPPGVSSHPRSQELGCISTNCCIIIDWELLQGS